MLWDACELIDKDGLTRWAAAQRVAETRPGQSLDATAQRINRKIPDFMERSYLPLRAMIAQMAQVDRLSVAVVERIVEEEKQRVEFVKMIAEFVKMIAEGNFAARRAVRRVLPFDKTSEG